MYHFGEGHMEPRYSNVFYFLYLSDQLSHFQSNFFPRPSALAFFSSRLRPCLTRWLPCTLPPDVMQQDTSLPHLTAGESESVGLLNEWSSFTRFMFTPTAPALQLGSWLCLLVTWVYYFIVTYLLDVTMDRLLWREVPAAWPVHHVGLFSVVCMLACPVPFAEVPLQVIIITRLA